MTRPVDTYQQVQGARRRRTVKLHSYVVTLTEIGGDGVAAVRFDGYQDTQALWPELKAAYAGSWKVKSIQKLYDSDFE